MPDIGNLSQSSSLSLSHCPSLELIPIESADCIDAFDPATLETLAVNCMRDQSMVQKRVTCNGNGIKVLKKVKKGSNCKVLEDYLRAWVQRKMESGLPQSCYFLPFFVGAKRLVPNGIGTGLGTLQLAPVAYFNDASREELKHPLMIGP